MKKILLNIVFALCAVTVMAQNFNMTLRSQKTYTGGLSNIGGIAVNGGEYALVGWEYGLSIVNVTDPDNISEVVNIPGAQSIWREVKTHNNYAYVTTEASGDGLIIVNLNYLPDSAPYKSYFGDGAINGQLNTIHALHIDAGFVYLWGSNLFGGTGVICDLNADPWNPVYVGNTSGADPNYIHDGYIRNNILYGSHVYDGYFSIMDVTNKANPVLINTQSTPGTFTHNCWLNDAGTVLFTTDEINNSFLASYDISNPQNIELLDKYQTDPGSNVIVHNTHTLNDYEVVSWYKSGVVIVDIAHPDNMIETGHYDTSPLSGGGFDGCWGVYPYLPSGNLVASDMSEGLFVLTPTYVRGCYLEGAVSDSVTNVTLGNVRVEILGPSKVKYTNIQGLYKTGLADAGTYDVLFSKSGYYDKTITGVVLQNGVTTTLDVELIPQVAISFSGNVYDGTTNLPIANADVIITGANGNFSVTTDAAGNFTIPTFFGGTYDITAGQWGYVTNCQSLNITGGTVSIALHPGIYDDFTFNFNWSMSGSASSGLWERGEPLGTTNGNSAANPDFDVNNDCTDKAYVTGNTGVSGGDDDVDNGYTVIQSPVFDLTGYVNPIMNYSRWFYNAQGPQGGAPNDTLYIRIGNGSTIVNVQAVTATSPGNSAWVDESFPLNALITKTSAMRVYVYISDQANSGNVCEGGFDHFEIIEGPTAVNELTSTGTIAVYPNPYTNQSNLHYNFINANSGRLEVKNMLGETLKVYNLNANSGDIQLGNDMAKGVYIINLYTGEKQISTLKVVKL